MQNEFSFSFVSFFFILSFSCCCILRNKRLFSCCRSSILDFRNEFFDFAFALYVSLPFSLARQRNVLCCCCCCYAPTLCSSAARSLLCSLSLTLSLFAIEIPLQLQGKTHFDDTRFTTKTLACLQLSCSNNNNNSKAKTATTSISKHRLSWLSDTAASFKLANRARRNSAKR